MSPWIAASYGLTQALEDAPYVLKEAMVRVVRINETNPQGGRVRNYWLRFLAPGATDWVCEVRFVGVVLSGLRAIVYGNDQQEFAQSWPDDLGKKYIAMVGVIEEGATAKRVCGERVQVGECRIKSVYIRPDNETQSLKSRHRWTLQRKDVAKRISEGMSCDDWGPRWAFPSAKIRTEGKGQQRAETGGIYTGDLSTALTYCGLEHVIVFPLGSSKPPAPRSCAAAAAEEQTWQRDLKAAKTQHIEKKQKTIKDREARSKQNILAAQQALNFPKMAANAAAGATSPPSQLNEQPKQPATHLPSQLMQQATQPASPLPSDVTPSSQTKPQQPICVAASDPQAEKWLLARDGVPPSDPLGKRIKLAASDPQAERLILARDVVPPSDPLAKRIKRVEPSDPLAKRIKLVVTYFGVQKMGSSSD